MNNERNIQNKQKQKHHTTDWPSAGAARTVFVGRCGCRRQRPFETRETAMPDSAPPGQSAPSQGPSVNEMAMRALMHSKGVVRVPLEELGPALFNRQGQPTCGQHCRNIGTRILTLEGFFTFRYKAGFCHEPNPDDSEAVARHGNSMASNDNLLPRLLVKPLKGVFAKTHLVTFLQMFKSGMLPELLNAPHAPPRQGAGAAGSAGAISELQDVLDHGLLMHVIPWRVVRDDLPAVTALMASDNFDQGHGLTDSELRCIVAVREAISASSQGTLAPLGLPGGTQWDVVRRHVLSMSGQRWTDAEIGHFWDFAKSTLESHLELLLTIWTFAGCESVLRVESAFFGGLSKVPAKLQWTRTSLAVAHFLSDQETECSVVGGQCIAGAVPARVYQRIRQREPAPSQDWEDWLNEAMAKYWLVAGCAPAGRPGPSLVMKGLAAFLARAGRFAISNPLTATAEQRTKLETKLRSALQPVWLGSLPAPISGDSLGKPTPAPGSTLDGEPLVAADSQGLAVVSVKREARLQNLTVGARVSAKRRKVNDTEETATAVITGVSDAGVTIKWESGAAPSQVPRNSEGEAATLPESETLPPESLALLADQKGGMPEAECEALAQPAVCWSPTSSAENADMLLKLLEATLYQAFVARSCAHEELHMILDDKGVIRLHAKKQMPAGAMILLPFGDVDNGKSASKAGGVPVAVVIATGARSTTQEFRVRGKTVPKKLAGTAETAVALVPFWVLASRLAAPNKSEPPKSHMVAELVYRTAVMDVAQAPAVMLKGGKKSKESIKINVICMVNEAVVPKGSMLIVRAAPPEALSVPE